MVYFAGVATRQGAIGRAWCPRTRHRYRSRRLSADAVFAFARTQGSRSSMHLGTNKLLIIHISFCDSRDLSRICVRHAF